MLIGMKKKPSLIHLELIYHFLALFLLGVSALIASNNNDCIATLGYRASCIQNSPSQKVVICKYYPPQDEINVSVHTDGELEVHFVEYLPDMPVTTNAKDAGKNIFPSNTDFVDVSFDKTSLEQTSAPSDKDILVYNRNDFFYNSFLASISVLFHPLVYESTDEEGHHQDDDSYNAQDKTESTFIFNTRGIGNKKLIFNVIGYRLTKDENNQTAKVVKSDIYGEPYIFPVKLNVKIIP